MTPKPQPPAPPRTKLPTMTAIGPRSDSRARAHEAYQLRCMNRSWQEIAQAKGYKSAASAYKAVQRHIERMPAEDQAMARAFSAGNYRLVIGQLYEVAAKAKSMNKPVTAVQALTAIADVQDKHDKLCGLHVPVAQQVDVTVHQSPAAVLERAEAELVAAYAPPAALPAGEILDAEVVPA